MFFHRFKGRASYIHMDLQDTDWKKSGRIFHICSTIDVLHHLQNLCLDGIFPYSKLNQRKKTHRTSTKMSPKKTWTTCTCVWQVTWHRKGIWTPRAICTRPSRLLQELWHLHHPWRDAPDRKLSRSAVSVSSKANIKQNLFNKLLKVVSRTFKPSK